MVLKLQEAENVSIYKKHEKNFKESREMTHLSDQLSRHPTRSSRATKINPKLLHKFS